MATRFYLPSTGAADISPAASAGWETTSLNSYLKAVTTKISSAMTTVSFTDSDATNRDILFRTYVTDPISPQVISAQTLEFQIRAKERATTCNLFTVLNVKVVSNDGSITRGTVLSMQRDATELDELALENRRLTATTTAVTCHAGDRLVFEIGTGGDPGAGSDHDSDISIGDDSGTDLPEDDTDQNAYNPWIEFPNSLTFWQTGDIIVHEITENNSEATSSPSFSHTVSANLSNRGLLVLVGAYGAGASHVTSATYNSVAMTVVGYQYMIGDTVEESVSALWLSNPASGANTLALTMAASVDNSMIVAITLGNVGQTGNPEDYDPISEAAVTEFDVNSTPTTDRSLVFGVIATNGFGGLVQDAGQIFLADAYSGFYCSSYEGPITPAAATDHGYSNGNTDKYALIAVAIKKYTASTGSVMDIIGSGMIPYAR